MHPLDAIEKGYPLSNDLLSTINSWCCSWQAMCSQGRILSLGRKYAKVRKADGTTVRIPIGELTAV
jgi:hypothetical protein